MPRAPPPPTLTHTTPPNSRHPPCLTRIVACPHSGLVLDAAWACCPPAALQDGWLDNRLTVMQFVGTWLYVGPDGPGITQQGVEYISLAVDKNGAPLVAFQVGGAQTLRAPCLTPPRQRGWPVACTGKLHAAASFGVAVPHRSGLRCCFVGGSAACS